MSVDIKSSFKRNADVDRPRIKILNHFGDDFSVTFSGFRLDIPATGETLIKDLDLTLRKGEKYALTGANGSGKSSLFRVLRNLWDHGEGIIETTGTGSARYFCAAQKPRLPDTTLDGVIAYPFKAEDFSHEEYEQVLRDVGLEKLIRHFPWKTVEAQNLLELCGPFAENEIRDRFLNVSRVDLNDFINALHETLEKRLKVPAPLEKHFTDKNKSEFLSTIDTFVRRTADVSRMKAHGALPVSRPESTGHKAGKKIADFLFNTMQRGLRTGNRLALSGGEEQKLVFARIFMQRPDILFLDEITSALSEDATHKLYAKMIGLLPDSIVISIVHDDELIPYHTHHANLKDRMMAVTELKKDPEPAAEDLQLSLL